MKLPEQLRKALELGAEVRLEVNPLGTRGSVIVIRHWPSTFRLVFSSTAELHVFSDSCIEAGLMLQQVATEPNGATIADLALKLRT